MFGLTLLAGGLVLMALAKRREELDRLMWPDDR
jgi:hypothetical protein